MSLREKILTDLKSAMKERDTARIKILRFINAAIKNKEIELRPNPLTEEHISGALKKQIKQIKESLEYYKKAGYKDQIKEEEFQLSVLESYLPQSLSEEELRSLALQAIKDLNAQSLKDMGAVMKEASAKAKGAADGKTLSQVVRGELSKLQPSS